VQLVANVQSTQDKRVRVHLWAPGFGSTGGGIAMFSEALARSLASSCSRVDATLFGRDSLRGNGGGPTVIGAGTWPPSLRPAAFAGRLTVSAIRHRPAMIISTHLNFGPLALGLRAAFGTPYALVAHGIDVNPELSVARRKALRTADAVWAVSRWTRDRLINLGVPAARISMVPNTVSDEQFSIGPPDDRLRARYGLRTGEKVVLTVARLDGRERYKGYDRVLEALPSVCEAVGPVRYLVVGRGEDTVRLRRLAEAHGMADRLTLCGFVPDTEMAAHYRLADVFAMPSTGEGFGIVFLEAMACGVPVLGGNRDGTVDALADGEFGKLVEPGDAQSIARGIVQLLRRLGPPQWYDPHALRTNCLRRFGLSAFQARVFNAVEHSIAGRGGHVGD